MPDPELELNPIGSSTQADRASAHALLCCKILIDGVPVRVAAMPATKGTRPPNAGKGRPKGARNKVTKNLRGMILGALDDAGGQAYLAEQAQSNPSAFLALLGKVLPPEPRVDLPTRITFNMGTRDLRPPKDVTPAAAERQLPMARLPVLDEEC